MDSYENSYEQKQADRRARLNAAADRAEERSLEAYKKADLREAASGIPFGQPIIVGHHSEGRHRAAIKRADNAMRKSVEESKRADALRAKAATVGSGGISSDDPDAIKKLKEKLSKLEQKQATMKAANKVARKWSKKGFTKESTCADFNALLKELAAALKQPVSREQAMEIISPPWCTTGHVGFPPSQLNNNNAEIKRLENRIEQLEKVSEAETKEHDLQGVCKMVENVEENRLQFVFVGKPNKEQREIMKSRGFRWAPSQGAWQRKLTGNAIFSGKLALRELGEKL